MNVFLILQGVYYYFHLFIIIPYQQDKHPMWQSHLLNGRIFNHLPYWNKRVPHSAEQRKFFLHPGAKNTSGGENYAKTRTES